MKTILFAVGIRNDWKKYMGSLISLARREGAGVHVLETAAPIGTGEFTSNPVQNEDYPVEPSSPAVSAVNPADRETAADTGVAADLTNAYLEEMVAYLRDHGVEAVWDWQPDFRREDLADYAGRVGAQTVALVRRGFLTEFIQQRHIHDLEAAGFTVVELEKA